MVTPPKQFEKILLFPLVCSCLAVGSSLNELGDAYCHLVSLQALAPAATQHVTPSGPVQEAAAAAVVEPELFRSCGRDWGELTICLERVYLSSAGLRGCCGNVRCSNFTGEKKRGQREAECETG